MRDDLHRSFPPRHHWGAVLRGASGRVSEPEMIHLIVRAVRKDASWLESDWGAALTKALDDAGADIFGREKVEADLRVLMESSPALHARSVCELALGCIARGDSPGLGFRENVLREALGALARDCVEQVTARVAQKFDYIQARQVHSFIVGRLPLCEFLRPPPPREKKAASNISSDLDIALELAS